MNDKLTDLDIQTILVFAKNNMNVSKTAQELFFHCNTIRYHLEKVERVTGLNPFKFYDLVELVFMANKAGVTDG